MNLHAYAISQGGTSTTGCRVLTEIAQRAACSVLTLYQISRGHKLPSAKMALRLEQASDGAVSRHDLRPDIFGPPQDTAAPAVHAAIPPLAQETV